MPFVQRPTYDEDFYAWTQDQAAALRGLTPAQIGNHLDIDHVAEEIADLGKRDIREVESYLRQLLVHLLKLVALPHAIERTHWISEAEEFQARAAETFKPSMMRALDLERAWALACRAATSVVGEMGAAPLKLPSVCPFNIATLVSPEFDLRAATARMADLCA